MPVIPDECAYNGHMFYIKVKDLDERTRLIAALKGAGISAPYHYVPLHSSKSGVKYTAFHGKDVYTTKESERLIRLPLYYGLRENEVIYTADQIKMFYKKR